MVDDQEVPIICGNLTGARHCPREYTCLCVGPNPNHGYTNFDNFLWSMLTTFQLITLDYWENVYDMVSFDNIIILVYFKSKMNCEFSIGFPRYTLSKAQSGTQIQEPENDTFLDMEQHRQEKAKRYRIPSMFIILIKIFIPN